MESFFPEVKLIDDLKVAGVTVLCTVLLVVISRFVIGTQLDPISQFTPIYVFAIFRITRYRAAGARVFGAPFFWAVTVVIVTAAVLVVYAVLNYLR